MSAAAAGGSEAEERAALYARYLRQPGASASDVDTFRGMALKTVRAIVEATSSVETGAAPGAGRGTQRKAWR